MMQKAPQCNAAFGDEWAKRMLRRASADDFLNVVVAAFERYFTDHEIKQMIEARSTKGATLSAELKQKLDKLMPSIQSEIMGGCVQVGAKLGAEIGQEIAREHPEYCEPSAPAN